MEIGQKLPEVLGTDQDGKEWHLSDFAGKKLVLYIYPRDATPGCTSEACNLRDNYERFLAQGYPIDCRYRPEVGAGARRLWREEDGGPHVYGRFPHHLHHR